MDPILTERMVASGGWRSKMEMREMRIFVKILSTFFFG